MSLVDGNGMYMPVAPAGNGGWGNGGFGNDGWWVILLLFALGWGNNGGGFGGGNGNIQRGFDTAAITNQLSGIQASISNGFANAEVAECNRAMQAMNQNFALQSQFANCCCENRLSIANLAADLAREACADRQAVADGVQRILDKLCDQELMAERRENENLRTQLNLSNLRASQIDQTAQILADNARQTVALEQYLNPTPIPAYVVANPNCCQTTSCGCGGFYN